MKKVTREKIPLPDMNKLCLNETHNSVISLSTDMFIAQPIPYKYHHVYNRLFVQGFPPSTTAKEVSALFEFYGKILDTNVIRPLGYKWCYGFVTFQHRGSIDEILEESANGMTFSINGKILRVSEALFKPKKPSPFTGKKGRSMSLPTIDRPPRFHPQRNQFRRGSLDSNMPPKSGRQQMCVHQSCFGWVFPPPPYQTGIDVGMPPLITSPSMEMIYPSVKQDFNSPFQIGFPSTNQLSYPIKYF